MRMEKGINMLGKCSAEICTHRLVFSDTKLLVAVVLLPHLSLHLWALLDQAKLGICV